MKKYRHCTSIVIAQIKPLYAIEFTRAVKANYSPSVERNCREQIRGNHPVRLRRCVQTQCKRPSIFVLGIVDLLGTQKTTPSGCAAAYRRNAIASVYLY